MAARQNVIGRRYGRLVVMDDGEPRNGVRTVRAQCDCGTIKTIVLGALRSGSTKSCGCFIKSVLRENQQRAEPQIWQTDGDVASALVGETVVLVDAADVLLVSGHYWRINDNGYATALRGKLLMHRLILGLERGDPREGDHIHHNKTDNRRAELRVVTKQQNKFNSLPKRTSGTKSKGVTYSKAERGYIAQISKDGRYKRLGLFESEAEAAAAYNRAAVERFGEYACLN